MQRLVVLIVDALQLPLLEPLHMQGLVGLQIRFCCNVRLGSVPVFTVVSEDSGELPRLAYLPQQP